MTDQPISRRTAKATAVTLACLLMAASPLAAQDTAPEATPSTGDAGIATDITPEPAPAEGAPAATTDPVPAPVEAGQEAGTPAETPAETAAPADAAPADTDAAAADAAPAQTAPVDAPAETTAEAPTTDPATAPAEQATPQTAAPAADTDPAQQTPATATPETPAPAAEAPATDAAATAVPAEAPVEEPASEGIPFLPDSVQRAIAPLLEQPERDPNLPHDLSPLGMYQQADIVVKAVMIGLAFASIVTWTVLLVKSFEIWRASGNVARARRRIEDARDLPDALRGVGRRRDPASRMVQLAMKEYERSLPAITQHGGEDGLKERVASHLDQVETQTGRSVTRGTGLLATIASTAPFVGLFGTVWGIMNSFIGIAESQTTNLAVVAPGIAEALLATAIGLVAAIPAVVFYNVFARWIAGYRQRLSFASAGVQRLVSRDLDFRKGA